MKKIYIYCADVYDQFSNEDYQMQEINLCEYGETWDGNVRGYIENADNGEIEIRDESALHNIRQNFGGLDPLPGSIAVTYRDGEPMEVYWASEKLAGWAV